MGRPVENREVISSVVRVRNRPGAPIATAELDLWSMIAEPCPCDGCPLRQQCAAQRMACERYALFVYGRAPEQWRLATASPTKARFEALFS